MANNLKFMGRFDTTGVTKFLQAKAEITRINEKYDDQIKEATRKISERMTERSKFLKNGHTLEEVGRLVARGKKYLDVAGAEADRQALVDAKNEEQKAYKDIINKCYKIVGDDMRNGYIIAMKNGINIKATGEIKSVHKTKNKTTETTITVNKSLLEATIEMLRDLGVSNVNDKSTTKLLNSVLAYKASKSYKSREDSLVSYDSAARFATNFVHVFYEEYIIKNKNVEVNENNEVVILNTGIEVAKATEEVA